jgi:nitroreductase
MSEMDSYPDEKREQAERTMAIQSVAAAGLQLLLAAHAEDLGGVWACWPLFAQDTIQKTLELCESWEPQGIFFLGHPVEIPESRQRKTLAEIALWVGAKSQRDETPLETKGSISNPEGMA